MMLLDWLTSLLRDRAVPSPVSTQAIIAGLPPADSPVVQRVAERLRQGDLAAGGWSVEAGALPLESYLPEAQRLVRNITLGDTAGGPPAP